jgi:hypothetical protein
METKRVETREQLKLGLAKRILVLVIGVVAALLDVLPWLYELGTQTTQLSERTRGIPETVPMSQYVTPVVVLVLLGLIAYGVFDAVRLALRYWQIRNDEQQMFP